MSHPLGTLVLLLPLLAWSGCGDPSFRPLADGGGDAPPIGASDAGESRPLSVGCAPRSDDFSVKFSAPIAGSKVGNGDCDLRFADAESVQVMGMQPYFNAPGSADRRNHVAIQPFETGNYVVNAINAMPPAMDTDSKHKPFAFGQFTTEWPDSQDICHVTMFANPAEVQYDTAFLIPDNGGNNGGDGGTGDGGSDGDVGMCIRPGGNSEPQTMFEPLHIRYEFSDLRLYVTTALTGSIVTAELTYTSFTGAASCSVKYRVRGLSPSVTCADACGKPDPTICDNDPGIPKEIHTQCDPDSMLCVLADGTIPGRPADTHIPQ